MAADEGLDVQAARSGDHAAFDAIVRQYQDRIARYLVRLLNDPDLALDLTQDTFVEAFRGIHSLRSDTALSAWLYRIATHQAMRIYRRNRIIHWLSLSRFEENDCIAVEAPDNAVIDRELVNSTFHQLPRERAACLLLHVKEGFNYEEVAVIMHSTPEAVRKRIARAKKQFRASYDAASSDRVEHRAVR